MSELEMRGNISTRLMQITAYAEDILIVARTDTGRCTHEAEGY
jgi:porphobilinogen deaminase